MLSVNLKYQTFVKYCKNKFRHKRVILKYILKNHFIQDNNYVTIS